MEGESTLMRWHFFVKTLCLPPRDKGLSLLHTKSYSGQRGSGSPQTQSTARSSHNNWDPQAVCDTLTSQSHQGDGEMRKGQDAALIGHGEALCKTRPRPMPQMSMPRMGSREGEARKASGVSPMVPSLVHVVPVQGSLKNISEEKWMSEAQKL